MFPNWNSKFKASVFILGRVSFDSIRLFSLPQELHFLCCTFVAGNQQRSTNSDSQIEKSKKKMFLLISFTPKIAGFFYLTFPKLLPQHFLPRTLCLFLVVAINSFALWFCFNLFFPRNKSVCVELLPVAHWHLRPPPRSWVPCYRSEPSEKYPRTPRFPKPRWCKRSM